MRNLCLALVGLLFWLAPFFILVAPSYAHTTSVPTG